MTTLRSCIIDNDSTSTQKLRTLIQSSAVYELTGTFTTLAEATKTVLAEGVDVVFLSTDMPSMSGIEFAKILPASVSVIFLSPSTDLAYDAIKAGAVDYLLKPLKKADFLAATNRLINNLSRYQPSLSNDNQYIVVKSDYKLLQIPLCDILFIEGLKDYVKIYLTHDQKSVMTLMSMRALEEYLPSSRFMRIHRSYIVNLEHMRMIERARVVIGSHYLPISESYRNVFNEYVAAHSVGIQAPPSQE